MSARRFCIACEATWTTGDGCFLCGTEGVLSEFRDPEGWPLLTLPRDWEPAPEPATVLRRARNALRR